MILLQANKREDLSPLICITATTLALAILLVLMGKYWVVMILHPRFRVREMSMRVKGVALRQQKRLVSPHSLLRIPFLLGMAINLPGFANRSV